MVALVQRAPLTAALLVLKTLVLLDRSEQILEQAMEPSETA